MAYLLSIQQMIQVTGAKKDKTPSGAMIPPNVQPEPQPLFKDLPTFDLGLKEPKFDPVFYGASKNHLHAGLDYHVNPNVSVGMNASVNKHGDVNYFGINGSVKF